MFTTKTSKNMSKQKLQFKKSPLRDFKRSSDLRYTCGLSTEGHIATSAKVMLTKNLDVSYGVVNGAQGKEVGLIRCGKDTDKKILVILIEFDSKSVGQNARQTSQFLQNFITTHYQRLF